MIVRIAITYLSGKKIFKKKSIIRLVVNHSQIVAMSFVDKLIGPFSTSNSYKKFFVHELVQHMKTLNQTFQCIHYILLLLLHMAFHTFIIYD